MFANKAIDIAIPAGDVSETVSVVSGDAVVIEVHSLAGKTGTFAAVVSVSIDGTNYKLLPTADILDGRANSIFAAADEIIIKPYPYVRMDNSAGTGVRTAKFNLMVRTDL